MAPEKVPLVASLNGPELGPFLRTGFLPICGRGPEFFHGPQHFAA